MTAIDVYALPYRRPDDVALDVLDVLVANGGQVVDVAGYVLRRLAEETETSYFSVATAVRLLEAVGFVTVHRSCARVAYKGNRLEAVILTV